MGVRPDLIVIWLSVCGGRKLLICGRVRSRLLLLGLLLLLLPMVVERVLLWRARKRLVLGKAGVEVVASVKVLLQRRVALRARTRHQGRRGELRSLSGTRRGVEWLAALRRERVVVLSKDLAVILALAHAKLADAGTCKIHLALVLPLLLLRPE